MENKIKIAGYITEQPGYAIFGTGKTAEAALENAKEWSDAGRTEGFVTYPATAALLAKVEDEGGAISFSIVDGIACTNDEADMN